MPLQRVINKLKNASFCDGSGKSLPKFQWLGYNHKEILLAYNAVISGIFNYYSFANNINALSCVYNILRSSAAKLLAAKYKLKSQRKVFKKFGKGLKCENVSLIVRKDWGKNPYKFNTKDVKTEISTLYITRRSRTLLKKICTICNSTEKVEMHHVKHIRKMNTKLTPMEKSMVSLNRKQIPVCRKCHLDIHNGLYDGINLKDLIKNRVDINNFI